MKAVPKGVVRAVTIVLAIVAFVLVQSFLAHAREEKRKEAWKENFNRSQEAESARVYFKLREEQDRAKLDKDVAERIKKAESSKPTSSARTSVDGPQ